jgi:hypothetical protein
MSIALREQPGGKLLVLFLSGKLTVEDFERFTPHLVTAVKAHGKVRVLVRMHHFHGWATEGQWRDVKPDLRHFSDIERVALVGERLWASGVATVCKSFTTAAVRYFEESKAEEADQWIREGIEPTANFVDAISGEKCLV